MVSRVMLAWEDPCLKSWSKPKICALRRHLFLRAVVSIARTYLMGRCLPISWDHRVASSSIRHLLDRDREKRRRFAPLAAKPPHVIGNSNSNNNKPLFRERITNNAYVFHTAVALIECLRLWKVSRAHSQLSQYEAKYGSRLKGKNAFYVGNILRFLRSVLKLLKKLRAVLCFPSMWGAWGEAQRVWSQAVVSLTESCIFKEKKLVERSLDVNLFSDFLFLFFVFSSKRFF